MNVGFTGGEISHLQLLGAHALFTEGEWVAGWVLSFGKGLFRKKCFTICQVIPRNN